MIRHTKTPDFKVSGVKYIEKKMCIRDRKSCEGRVRIDHVSFAYRKDQKLIENFNLETKPGQRIAIVGPTGCGKTTMINLLMRFYDVNQGEISVDGVPVKEMTRDSLRRLFGMVLQDTWLYSATVRENIAYGKPNATMEEIRAAAKAAYADGFIRRMPQGYDLSLIHILD